MHPTQKFCQDVKRFAATFKTFDEFFNKVKVEFPNYKRFVKENEMSRLISVASVEANLY